eukprot:3708131-Rhodomonas_salina.1
MRFVLYICAFALLSGCRSCVDAKGQRASRGPSAWNTHDGNCTHAKEPFLCPPLPSLPRLFARSLHSPLASSVLNASEDINLRAHPFSSLLVFITGREEPLEWRSTNRDPRNPPLLGRPRLLLGDQGAASRQVSGGVPQQGWHPPHVHVHHVRVARRHCCLGAPLPRPSASGQDHTRPLSSLLLRTRGACRVAP